MRRPPPILAVFAGGVAGSALRVGVTGAGESAIAALLVVNLTGALALGVLIGWRRQGRGPGTIAVPLLGVGLFGSLTTFSGMVTTAADSLRDGAILGPVVFLTVSVVGGVVLARLGVALGERR